MICKNCGTEIQEGSAFCTNCGAAAEVAAPAQNPQPVYAQPAAGIKTVSPAKVLVWGILGIAFACTFYLSFLGIIFSAVALSKAKVFLAENGMLYGPAKVGRILAKVGLILGIILTAICLIVVIIAIAGAATVSYY